MTDPVWTNSPAPEEREYLAEQLRQRDELQRANDRVPTFARKAAPLPQVTMRSTDVDNVSLPAPSSATFYSKNSSSPRSGATVGPDDLVEIDIPGMGRQKTSVANALSMGLIATNPGGGYRGLDANERADINAVNRQEEQQEQQQERAELETLRATGDAADVPTSQLIDAVSRAVPASDVQALVYDMATSGSMSESAVARAAEAAGWTADQGKRIAMELIEGLSRQAATAVASQGVPRELVGACYDWAAQHRPVDLQHARIEIALGSDVTALKRIAKDFYLHRVVKRSA